MTAANDERWRPIETMSKAELVQELESHVRATFDFLDGGVFSPTWVIEACNDPVLMLAAFEPVSNDNRLLKAHQMSPALGRTGAPGCCEVDADNMPCPTITDAVVRYRSLRSRPGAKPTFMKPGEVADSVPSTQDAVLLSSLWDGLPF